MTSNVSNECANVINEYIEDTKETWKDEGQREMLCDVMYRVNERLGDDCGDLNEYLGEDPEAFISRMVDNIFLIKEIKEELDQKKIDYEKLQKKCDELNTPQVWASILEAQTCGVCGITTGQFGSPYKAGDEFDSVCEDCDKHLCDNHYVLRLYGSVSCCFCKKCDDRR